MDTDEIKSTENIVVEPSIEEKPAETIALTTTPTTTVTPATSVTPATPRGRGGRARGGRGSGGVARRGARR